MEITWYVVLTENNNDYVMVLKIVFATHLQHDFKAIP